MKSLTSTTTSLPAVDIARAQAFYRDVLGLEPDEVVQDGHQLHYSVGGSSFVVFVSSGRPSGTHTQMAFQVGEIDAAAADLRARGVAFEEFEGLDQVDGLVTMGTTRGGWIRDSEGNLLSVIQELR